MHLSGQAESLLYPLPIPAYLWDLRTERFIGWNPPLLDLLGYTEEELCNLDWLDLLVLEERAIERGPEMETVRWQWRKKNGEVIAVTLAARRTMFVDDDNKLKDVYIGLVMQVGTDNATSAASAL